MVSKNFMDVEKITARFDRITKTTKKRFFKAYRNGGKVQALDTFNFDRTFYDIDISKGFCNSDILRIKPNLDNKDKRKRQWIAITNVNCTRAMESFGAEKMGVFLCSEKEICEEYAEYLPYSKHKKYTIRGGKLKLLKGEK